jgi:tetratricopeptide (TPR) repeat protein
VRTEAIRRLCLAGLAVLLNLAILLAWQPDPALLGQLYLEALERKQREYGASDVRTAPAARDLGLFLSKHGSPANARKVFAELVRLDEVALGTTAIQTLADVASLANVSPPAQAEPLWRRASASPEHKVAARAFAALGQLREDAGDQTAAATFYRQALAKQEAALEQAATIPEKAKSAILLSGIAQVFGQLVEPGEGVAVLRRSFSINRSVLGPRHPETATVEANLAGVLLDAGAVDESLRLIEDVLPILEQTLGEDHGRVAISTAILGHGLNLKGEFARAEQSFRRALAIDERAFGPKHPQTLNDVRTLAGFLRDRGKVQEAAVLEKRVANGSK